MIDDIRKKLESFIDEESKFIRVYCVDIVIVGFIMYNFENEILTITDLFVDERYRGTGIGSKLVEDMQNNHMSKYVVVEVMHNNEKAIDFYKNNNFKVHSIHMLKVNES